MTSVDFITAFIQNGWVRFLKGHDHDISKVKFKTGDEYMSHTESYLIIINIYGSTGFVYNLDVTKISIIRGSAPMSKFFKFKMNIIDRNECS